MLAAFKKFSDELQLVSLRLCILLSCGLMTLFISFAAYAGEEPTTPAATTTPAASTTPGSSSQAPTQLSAQTMVTNIADQIPYLMRLITAVAYVIGMYLIIMGIIRTKHLGESRTMMSQEHSVKGPIIFIVIGALLLYLPTSVQVGLSSFWAEPNPYGYVEQKDQWEGFYGAVFLIVQFVGAVAFIRGLVILSSLGHDRGREGTFSKGLVHIIGGILCINIYQFVQVMLVTLGLPPLY